MSYYADPNATALPQLRIAPNAPVQVTRPIPRSNGSKLSDAIDMKKIAQLLKQKYGGSAAAIDPDPDAPYLDEAASLDATAVPTAFDPDPDILYFPTNQA